MLRDDLRKFRESIFHTQREFAELLTRLRGASVSFKTIEHWEAGRRGVGIYQTDLAAISQAIQPQKEFCAICHDRSVVRKLDMDLCGKCASPLHRGQRPRAEVAIADHCDIATSIRPFLIRQASA